MIKTAKVLVAAAATILMLSFISPAHSVSLCDTTATVAQNVMVRYQEGDSPQEIREVVKGTIHDYVYPDGVTDSETKRATEDYLTGVMKLMVDDVFKRYDVEPVYELQKRRVIEYRNMWYRTCISFD